MLSRLYGGPRPAGGGFETFSWYYFRISGILLVFLVIGHITLTHVTTDVACTTYSFVAARYANPFWRLYDWLLLTLGLTHGVNGLRVVIDDYVRHPQARLALQGLAAVLLLVFFMLGTITLITFSPVNAAQWGPACVGGH
ncbi:succinate dehydrogenase / fumarate reductase membrane anchor subunit [Thermosporothrix hazakensis]|jgi:succinate dehydrogenase / fumarate reductase membrane anchor subunit|uniref:Succinate dehydrogenase hydrophobic membrane anchor subunit n=2 Tax=Thermosporothrix TaxID=768650 RepID=A0A326U1I8_THEHA|nr:succinate dehydrogenase, hydrophobic membrane anchor protein [Thermosporothrix hazakensis]PZW24723.1 succinate dehydrogenase / fumarate reductase membrane anchor subunit [Thermosporothrix hazakensis]BBH90294.1 succinate dehydrogenase [Thermosporothrix sp. COM3]GCE48331.1 succinate dehydrogenase [Thermosporothrix hazakensis]